MEIKLLDMLNDRSITFDDSIVDFISSTVIDKTMWHTQSSHWLFVYNRYARCLSLSTFIGRISIGHFHTSLCNHRSPIIYVLLWTSDCRLSSTRVGGLWWIVCSTRLHFVCDACSSAFRKQKVTSASFVP